MSGQEVGDAEWFDEGVAGAGGWRLEARLRRSISGFGLELQLI
jgi:hypothetical protein